MQYTRNGRIVPTLQAVESTQAVTQMILEEKHGRTNLGTIFEHHKERLRDSGPENEKTRCALYSSTQLFILVPVLGATVYFIVAFSFVIF